MSLYSALASAGVPMENHASDLYTKVTPESRQLVRAAVERGEVSGVTTFTSQIDGEQWYDVPFAYVPWWEAKQATAR